jgi:hypothetical protein
MEEAGHMANTSLGERTIFAMPLVILTCHSLPRLLQYEM